MRKDIDKFIIDFADIPYDRISIERVLTGYRDLDYFNKGIEVGVTEIVGDTNVGKSILTSSLLDCAINQGYSAGVFASEHTLRKYKMLMMQQNGKKGDFDIVPFVDKNGNDTNIADYYVKKDIEKKVNAKYNHKLFLFDTRYEDRDVDTLCDFMVECNKKHNIRFFVLDNFMEIENNNENQFQEQTSIITKIRNTALRLNLFVILVMHTNKASGADGFRLTVKSAFGTSNATNKAYNVWVLYRKDRIPIPSKQDKVLDKFKMDCAKCGFDYDSCDSFIEILKTKGNGNGIVGLTYEAETKTFIQSKKLTQTDADKIFKRLEKKEYQQQLGDWDNSKLQLEVEDGELFF